MDTKSCNEIADRAAKDSLTHNHIRRIKPSLGSLKSRAWATAKEIARTKHLVWVETGSPSATWYQIVTDHETITIPKSLPTREAVIIHRLRFGYRCNWDFVVRVPKGCDHCDDLVDEPSQALYT